MQCWARGEISTPHASKYSTQNFKGFSLDPTSGKVTDDLLGVLSVMSLIRDDENLSADILALCDMSGGKIRRALAIGRKVRSFFHYSTSYVN